LQVGVNYPWFNYGWDFGLGPPEWRGRQTTSRWHGHIAQHLQQLYALGIRLVRWFILADGLTYGTGSEAPNLHSGSSPTWRFDPPLLGTDVLEHFDELLRQFAAFNAGRRDPVRLLPVLIDFHFCDSGFPILKPDPADPLRSVPDPDWIKQGRADAVADPARRRRFLEHALDPLLHVSQRNADVIYAWELINEPEWVTNTWHPDGRNDHPIGAPAMRAFLEEGKDHIRRAGFRPTIGFALLDTLLASGIISDINQFHHYPDATRDLPRHTFDPRFPAIIGEFATAASDIWPELPIDRQSVLQRLRRAETQGYPLAIAWSFRAHDRHTSWSAAVQQDLIAFSEQQPGTAPSLT
jgi:hypothetical protein